MIKKSSSESSSVSFQLLTPMTRCTMRIVVCLYMCVVLPVALAALARFENQDVRAVVWSAHASSCLIFVFSFHVTARAHAIFFCVTAIASFAWQLPSNSLIAKRIAMFSPEDAPSNREPGNGRSFFSIERTYPNPFIVHSYKQTAVHVISTMIILCCRYPARDQYRSHWRVQ